MRINRYLKLVSGTESVIMAIINLTNNSFADDGLADISLDQQLLIIDEKIKEGAQIIDLGAESSKPGAEQTLSSEDEVARLVPLILALRKKWPEICISIDCWRASVAEAVTEAGADVINSIHGTRADPALADLVAAKQVPLIIMHQSPSRQASGQVRQDQTIGGYYQSAVPDAKVTETVLADLTKETDLLISLGYAPELITIDPGIGFGKSPAENLSLIKNISLLTANEFPVLLGASNKSFIGYVLGKEVAERRIGTQAVNIMARLAGVRVFRVHDVAATRDALMMTAAICSA